MSLNMLLCLRFPAVAFEALDFFGVAFLMPPFAAFLRGVLGVDFALETLKWPEVPEALAV